MGYVSKYDRTFISFVNHKYVRYGIEFKTWDDYVLWLYYKHCMKDIMLYYKKLEEDLWEYSDFQTGSARKREKLQEENSCKVFEEINFVKKDF